MPSEHPIGSATRVLEASPDSIAVAVELLRHGSLVAFPTETVYGLGADAADPDAVKAVFVAKGRPATDPLIVHVASTDQARLCGDLDVGRGDGPRLAEAFWPGPLTLVVPRHGTVTEVVGGGLDTVGLRIPAHPVALALIRGSGLALAAPSANRFGRVSPTCADHVVQELEGRVELVLDAGPTPLGVESTVVALGEGPPVVLRPGGVTIEDLREVVADTELRHRLEVEPASAAHAPGTRTAHYAPDVPVTLVEAGPETTEAIAAALRGRGLAVEVMALPSDPVMAARTLYARLRELDRLGADAVLVEAVGGGGLGRAINDRLFRAAHGHVVLECSTSVVDRIFERASDGGSSGSA
jgi:L-threonylcarbamoyladenylate synthase